jgi:hypothetical protein
MVMREDKPRGQKASLHGGNVDLAWLKEFSPALSAKLPPLRGGASWSGKGVMWGFRARA